MAFLIGAPKVLFTPSKEPVLHAQFDRSYQLLATVSESSLCIWSGGKERVLLASYLSRDSVDNAKTHGFKQALWRPNSSDLAVLTRTGVLHYFSIIKTNQSTSTSLFAANEDTKLTLQFRHEERIPSRFISCSVVDSVGIACGTSEGELIRITWSGHILLYIHISDASSKYAVARPRDILEPERYTHVDTDKHPSKQGGFWSLFGAAPATMPETKADPIPPLSGPRRRPFPAGTEAHAAVGGQSGAPAAGDAVDGGGGGGGAGASRISMAEVETSQPSALHAVYTCRRLAVYGCLCGPGGAFLCPIPGRAAQGDTQTVIAMRTWLRRDGASCLAFGRNDEAHGLVKRPTPLPCSA